jgi:diguanylate cyclase (GGDEF)-like protein
MADSGPTTAAPVSRLWLSPRRLSTRIVLTFLGMLLLVQGLGFLGLQSTLEAKERQAIEADLKVGRQALHSLLERNAERLASGARLAARDHGFTSTVDSDAATIADALANNVDRLCETGLATAAARAERERCSTSTVAALFDTQFKPLGSTRDDLPDLAPLARDLARSQRACRGPRTEPAAGGLDNGAVVMVGRQLMQVVAVPRCAPLVTGWVLMGFALDQKLAQDLHDISGLHLVVMKRASEDLPWQASISTLSPEQGQALQLAVAQRLPEGTLQVGPEEFRALAVPLGQSDSSEAVAVLMRSVDEALAAFHKLRRGLLFITVGAMLMFALGSVFTARRITTPLRALVRASERLGKGSLDEPVPIPLQRDEVGELAGAVERMRMNIRDQQAEIRHLAFHDRLTGLPNRARLHEALLGAIHRAQADGTPFSLLLLGLNRFKVMNESLGYAFGDQVLMQVGRRLPQHAKQAGDLVARLSGDQFAILMLGAEPRRASAVADGIGLDFVRALVVGDRTVDVSATIGTASWPAHAPEASATALPSEQAEQLLARAEMAMYEAKRLVRPAMAYHPDIDAGSAQTLNLLSDLRQARANNELRLFLQPKIDLRSRRVVAAESLVRWQHPTRGLVPPLEFIPFAEKSGFISALTDWIFEETARQWPALHRQGLQHMAVNLSVRDLWDPALCTRLDAILRRCDVPASAFCLEIPEGAVTADLDRALPTLLNLSTAGFQLSLDDFGAEATALQYLKRLPLTELKIDQVFIKRLVAGSADAHIVDSVIHLAGKLGFRTVAEGVENADTLELLTSMGCDEAQGFHMSRPLPAADLPAFVSSWVARHYVYPPAADTPRADAAASTAA